MSPVLIGILAYVLLQFGIGAWVMRRIKTEDDYLLAGRSLGPVLATTSIFATWFGAESCVSAAGSVHAEGLGAHSVEPFAYGICLVLMGLLFAAPLWRTGITTLADLFRQRFGPRVESLAAILLIPTSVLWAGAQIRAFGHLLSTSSELGLETAIAIAAGLAIAYTALGGLLADVITDLVQGVALIIGLVVVTVAVVIDAGGAASAWELIATAPPRDPGPPLGLLETIETWAVPIFGSVLAQEVVSRSLASRNPGLARRAGVGGGLIYLAVGLMPVGLGLIAAHSSDLEGGDALLANLARQHLPTFGYVLFAGALVSAILSTVDSTLLVASSLLSRNLILSGREATDRTRVRLARLGVILFGCLAWALAHQAEDVYSLVEDASGFGSAGIFVAVVFGLFTRFGDERSAVAALLAGVAAWIAFAYVLADQPAPYLVSLGAAVLGYALFAVIGARRLRPTV